MVTSMITRGALPAVLLVCLLADCRKNASIDEEEKQPPVPVHCVAAARVAIDQTITLRGRTAPPPGGDLPVAAQIPGRVLETRVREGENLTKGAVIAVIDDLAPKAAEKQAVATLSRAKSAAVNAEAARDRIKALAAQGIAAKRDVEDANTRADAARADVEASEAALRLATGTLGRVEVRSTFAGVVTKVWRGPGALVDGTAATPIVEVAATGVIEFVADVTERELTLVMDGQQADVTLTSTAARLTGKVIARSRALDPATGLGVVRVQIEETAKDQKDDAPASIGAPPLGAFGKATIALGRREGVMVIPPSALRGAVADGAEIALCNGDKAQIRAVSVGYRDASQVEIKEGLKEGERVAIDHVLGLEDDTPIEEAKDKKP